MDLRRYLLDNLNYHCEYSINTAPIISIDTTPAISTIDAPTSSSITTSSTTTTGSTEAKLVLTRAFSEFSDPCSILAIISTTVNTFPTTSSTTTSQSYVTYSPLTAPLFKTITTSADVHECADYKHMPIWSDTSDLETVTCIPLPEGDSFIGDTQLSPSLSTILRPIHATTIRTKKSIVNHLCYYLF